MKSFFRLFIFLIVLYCYVYNPIFNIIGIGSVKIILFFAILYSLFNTIVFKDLVYFKVEAFLIILLIFYSIFSATRSEVGLLNLPYLLFIWFVESIYLPIVLVKFFENEFYRYKWDKLFITIGTTAAFITILLIFNPSINNYVRYTLIQTSGSEFDEYSLIRDFGIADGLRGSYSMIQGLILGLCFFELRRNSKYVLLIFPILISIAFNARTGLLALPVSILLLVFNLKLNFRLIIIFLILIVFVFNFESLFSSFISNNQETFNWLQSGYEEFVSSLLGEGSGVASETLFIDEKFKPANTFNFLFGTGNFGPTAGRVDNGYYYFLWFGGWIFMIIILVFVFYMFFRLLRIENEKYYVYLFFSLLLIFTIKSNYLFNPSGISRLIGLYYVYKILNHIANVKKDNLLIRHFISIRTNY
jgi:hypothetical protein